MDFSGRTSPFRHTTLCAVFFMAKTLLRYYEKVETSERGRLSCGNSAACVFRRYAHERGFRHIDDSCPRIHFEPCRAQSHLWASGICFASHTFRAVLHNNEKFRLSYLSSFVTCLIYGAVLDLFRLIPLFNPTITPPGSMDLWARIVMFVLGVPMSAFPFRCL